MCDSADSRARDAGLPALRGTWCVDWCKMRCYHWRDGRGCTSDCPCTRAHTSSLRHQVVFCIIWRKRRDSVCGTIQYLVRLPSLFYFLAYLLLIIPYFLYNRYLTRRTDCWDMDFGPILDKILKVIPNERHTYLFSATMTTKVAKLQRASLSNPVRVEVSKK